LCGEVVDLEEVGTREDGDVIREKVSEEMEEEI
jgi:hypothetical protein